MPKTVLAAPVLIAVAALAGCSAAGTATAAAAAPHAAAAAPKPSSSPSCKLKTTFDYIVRDDDPGAQVLAQEIGNVDYGNCTPALQEFAATAGQAPGECTTIAKASANPGYNVNAVPAAPLKGVIAESGPGCGN